jgi:hypothetical protein
VKRLTRAGALLILAFGVPAPMALDRAVMLPVARLLAVGFQPGDIIFRRGTSAASAVVLAGEAGGEFSHVGLVVVHGKGVFVVHASPAQTDGEQAETRIEPLAAFVQPSRASRVAVYRLDAAQVDHAKELAGEAAEISEGMARRHVPFDFRFEMTTRGSVYCTELVVRAYADAGVDLKVQVAARLPFMREPIVFPSNLLQSPVLKRVDGWMQAPGL